MKIFSEELVEKAVKELHIANLAQATIGDVLLVAQYHGKGNRDSFYPHGSGISRSCRQSDRD